MNERKTSSMLQRMPVILAVTAASYGLQLPPQVARTGQTGSTAHSARMQGSNPAWMHAVPGASNGKHVA